MRTLPPGWTESTLAEVSDVVSGATPNTGVPEYWGGDVAWITPDDLSGYRQKTIAHGARSLTRAGYESCSTRLMPAGAVLFTSRAPIGYVAIASGPVCTNQGFKSFVPSEGVLGDYLYWFLRYATPEMRSRGSGTTFPELSKTRAGETPIPIPPLREQQRIVAVIEEQFSRLDAAEESLRGARLKVQLLRGSAIESVFAGDWQWTTLGEIAEIAGGVTKDAKRQADPSFVEVPYLRVANVQRGYLDLSEIATIRVPPDKAATLELRPGDVLFNEGGDRDKLGRGWIWSGEIDHCIHQNHVFRARLNARFDPKFVSWHGNTFGRRWFDERGRQTTNLASLNLTTLKSFPVPETPLADQQRMVAEVERQLSLTDALANAIDFALMRSAALRRSILERAFSGHLVSQDPADEPGSALLERITAARATEPAPRARRRVSA